MGKYDPWDEFFADLDGEQRRFDLDMWEQLTGVKLPPSAREHAPWWSSAQYYAKWAQHGWRATPRLATNEVIFRRVGPPKDQTPEARKPSPPRLQPAGQSDMLLLGCVATKNPTSMPAKDLYASSLWSKRRGYAESTGKPWFILSAEYGLVDPDEVIQPYDRHLATQRREYREEWSRTTAGAVIAKARELGAQSVEIHAGAAYIDNGLADSLKRAGLTVVRPLRGLRQGEQLAWYATPHGPVSKPDDVAPSAPAQVLLPMEEQGGAVDRTVRIIRKASDGLVRFVETFRKPVTAEPPESPGSRPPKSGSSPGVSSSAASGAGPRLSREQQLAVVEGLLAHGRAMQQRETERAMPEFTPDRGANAPIINDSFAFLVAVVADYQVKAERAWETPSRLIERLGDWGPEFIAGHPREVEAAFQQPPALHRFPAQTAQWVVEAAAKVLDEYGGDAGSIWSDEPTAAELQTRLRSFSGISQKKAAMAVEILERQLGVPIRDLHGSDIAYDVHVRRVFLRSGLAERDDVGHMVAVARQLYPDRPGAVDNPAWDIGRRWCRPTHPGCGSCAIGHVCPRLIARADGVTGA